MWILSSGIRVVVYLLRFVAESSLWCLCCGILVVESLLWNPCCGIVVVENLLWNN